MAFCSVGSILRELLICSCDSLVNPVECVQVRGGSRIFRRGGGANDGKGEWGVPPPTQSREAFAIIVCD